MWVQRTTLFIVSIYHIIQIHSFECPETESPVECKVRISIKILFEINKNYRLSVSQRFLYISN